MLFVFFQFFSLLVFMFCVNLIGSSGFFFHFFPCLLGPFFLAGCRLENRAGLLLDFYELDQRFVFLIVITDIYLNPLKAVFLSLSFCLFKYSDNYH